MNNPANHRVALITGAAVRLGATTARLLHQHGYNIIIHCNKSITDAESLSNELNQQRENSTMVLQANLSDMNAVAELGQQSIAQWGRLDVLINNASAFYPTPLAELTQAQWDELFASNARAPLFLAQACTESLKQQQGCIINISDLYARRGLSNHSIYTMAKASLEAMTRSLAHELAPDVRVNGIAPGAILWPPGEELSEEKKEAIINKASLKKMGTPADIANAVLFLIEEGTYITGQVIHIDGGR
jgi:pteridine reductase